MSEDLCDEQSIVEASDIIELLTELSKENHTYDNLNLKLQEQLQPFRASTPSDQSVSDDMLFSSSPVFYPPSSPLPVQPRPQAHKRKLFQSLTDTEPHAKKARIIGGFEVDEEEDGDKEEATKCQRAATSSEQDVSRELVCNDQASEYTEKEKQHEQGAIKNSLQRTEEDPIMSERSSASNIATSFKSRLTPKNIEVHLCSGRTLKLAKRSQSTAQSYEEMIANRSVTAAGRAKKAYYGVDIHRLIDDARLQKELDSAAAEVAKAQEPVQSVERPTSRHSESGRKAPVYQMWTEKYRAKKFTELVGDERTHRSVLRWLKAWDEMVFPGNAKSKLKRIHEDRTFDQEKQHRKILLLTGPPGLGKTTLAHVCAKQAGYEVLEINASDDRSRDVVRGRIKDALGTETVRGIQEHGKARRAGRPVCVVVDEVDGVVSGSGANGGEGGFMKALIDLVQLDQRNSNNQQQPRSQKTKKGDSFRLMRPLILVCNDVYAPSLRPLRQSSLAEIIHVRKPPIDKVIARLQAVFEKESIPCDKDAIRRLCESSWGLGTRKQNSIGNRGAGEGDIRGILVQGEWAAHKLRATCSNGSRLTRKWVESHLGESAASQKGLGRGGVREVVERVFIEGAGLPNLPTKLSDDEARLVSESKAAPIGVADLRKRAAITALQEMINTCGEHDRLMTECFATYPTQIFQDDTLLSKPNASYEWLHFHDSISQRVHSGQEWELGSYLNTSACGFHSLFAAVDKGSRGWDNDKAQTEEAEIDVHPFAGLKADFTAYESQKQNRAVLAELQSNFSAPMLRLFSSVDVIATELVPNVAKMLAPEVKPVVIGGSGGSASVASVRKENERNCVKNAVRVMHGLNIQFEKVRIENESLGAHSNGGYALRMEPPLDTLTTFHISKPTTTSTTSSIKPIPATLAPAPVRYAVRQVLSQELYKEKQVQASLARAARSSSFQASEHDISLQDEHDESNKENRPISTTEKLKSGNYAAVPTTIPSKSTGINRAEKRDFFGRLIKTAAPSSLSNQPPSHSNTKSNTSMSNRQNIVEEELNSQRTWVSFHEGYSNAVRKYITLKELMDGF